MKPAERVVSCGSWQDRQRQKRVTGWEQEEHGHGQAWVMVDR
jgi:hypothetical protein